MRLHHVACTPLALAAALLLASASQAADRHWACTASYWDYEDCWSPFGLPSPTDTAWVSAVGGVNTVLRFDDFTDARSVTRLVVASPYGGPSVTFEQSGGSLSTARSEIGSAGARGTFRQTGGVHQSNELLLTGDGSSYWMQGGTLQTGAQASIGAGAQFLHEAGTANLTFLSVGRVDGVGTYRMDAGAKSGVLNAATLQVAHGGFMVLGGASRVTSQTLRVGDGGGASEFYFNGGTLAATSLVVGGSADGHFSHGYGTSTQLVQLVLGEQAGAHGELWMQGDGLLTSSGVVVGQQGTARVVHSSGMIRVTQTMTIGRGGLYDLSLDGRLEVTGSARVANHGSFNHVGGRFVGTLENHGQFLLDDRSIPNYFGIPPDFAGHLVNHGSVTLTGDTRFGDGLRNEASLDLLPTGRTLTLDGQGLENNGSFTMRGGTLTGNGPLTNHNSLSGHGRIVGDQFYNVGSLVQTGGNLALAAAGGVFNYGRWSMEAQRDLKLDGSGVIFSNVGALALNGGRVTGSGQLVNIGAISGSGQIMGRFQNNGTLGILHGEQVTVTSGFLNFGLVDLRGSAASMVLTSGQMLNQGLLAGNGRVFATIDNHAGGRIQAEGGVLSFSEPIQNAGVMVAEAGGTLLLQLPLASQTGTLQLNGGILDTGGWSLRNDGVVSGHGTLRGSVIHNAGQMQFSAGSTQLHGAVDNLGGGRIVVSGTGVATFYGTLQARAGSELRVSADSAAVFFGAVSQANGAAFTGDGTRYFEGGLSVGDSPGFGGSQGSVVFGSANVYRAEIGGLAAGSGFDHFAVGDLLSLGGTLQLSWWGDFEAQAGQRFDLFDWGSVGGAFAAIDFAAASLDAGLRWDTSRLTLDGSIGVVPEPGTWALMLAGMAALGHLARRRTGAAAAAAR